MAADSRIWRWICCFFCYLLWGNFLVNVRWCWRVLGEFRPSRWIFCSVFEKMLPWPRLAVKRKRLSARKDSLHTSKFRLSRGWFGRLGTFFLWFMLLKYRFFGFFEGFLPSGGLWQASCFEKVNLLAEIFVVDSPGIRSMVTFFEACEKRFTFQEGRLTRLAGLAEELHVSWIFKTV